jgi:hypothetical protein
MLQGSMNDFMIALRRLRKKGGWKGKNYPALRRD